MFSVNVFVYIAVTKECMNNLISVVYNSTHSSVPVDNGYPINLILKKSAYIDGFLKPAQLKGWREFTSFFLKLFCVQTYTY